MTHTSNNLNYGATITRVALGSVLLAHGLLKVFVFTIPGTVGFFESLGLPAIVAYLTIFGEIRRRRCFDCWCLHTPHCPAQLADFNGCNMGAYRYCCIQQ